ncbi:MAG: methylcobalamin:coenzyme M methyltransferase [Candidatus Latescibacteria bacterium ADurb.Bin168]|nr:MAG: methylcobalamin:coenzyme M methyltransferase [Candidatus Latescibacteria bacterium ADurb.Bin168]
MTARERVRHALSHSEPDRVPIDLGGMGSTNIMAIAYNRLKVFLGIRGGTTRLYDWGQQLCEPESWAMERFHLDVVSLSRSLSPVSDPERTREFESRFGGKWKPWVLPDGSLCEAEESFNPEPDGNGGWQMRNERGVWAVMPKSALYFDGGPANHPLDYARSVADLGDWKPGYANEGSYKAAAEKAQWLHENTDFAIMAGFGGGALEPAQGLRGWGQFMEDLAGDPDLADEIIGRLTDANVHNVKLFMEMVGPYLDLVQMGDDLGTQAGPQMSPAMYHRFIHPAHKAVYQTAKKTAPNVAIFLHSCGGIRPLLPDLIDEGVEALNPVQTNAVGMEPAGLKRDFGEKLTFWGGGAEVAGVLTYGTPDEVRAQVRERIRIFAPGGGFVFCQVHNIQANVPPENIVATYEAAYEFGRYPVS